MEELPAHLVILHGSFAAGRVHQQSDVDLIVVADFTERFFDRVDRIHPLNRDRLPIDVLCYTREEFHRMREDRDPLILTALSSGRVFERPSPAR